MTSDRKFMQIALKEGYKACRNNEGGPFGCCIVKNRRVLARTHNTVLKDKDPTAHAEINAIRKAARAIKNYDLSGCVIYTTTEPCPMCFSAIHWAKIPKIVYGTEIKDAAKLGFNELNVKSAKLNKLGSSGIKIQAKFMHEQCSELLDFWAKTASRKVY